MTRRALHILLGATLLAAASLALFLSSRPAPASTRSRPPAPPVQAKPHEAPEARGGPTLDSAFSRLPALRIQSQTTRELLELKLYSADGQVDEAAAQRLDQLLCDARDPEKRQVLPIARRTLQLLFKAAYHFGRTEVEVVSGYRAKGKRREGPHGTGAAIDFRLPGVPAAELARYLRQVPRTGVGVYTHPKTQYVHLDVRGQSFHWLDASPPRKRWREKSIGSKELGARDRAYTPELDLPEQLTSASSVATAATAR
jgi:uncharacterized protein YcbK (DUF882 family)